MSEEWQYQVRINLNEERSEMARRNANDVSLAPLGDILAKHNATLKCQYDAFAGYQEFLFKLDISQFRNLQTIRNGMVQLILNPFL